MVKKKDFLTSIADLLPEGLDESVLEKIADLLSNKITEEVKLQNADLTNKVVSFIRGNIEKLKEHAVKELELENETFRNAQLFETMRSMFAVEVTPDDEVNGVSILASLGESQEQKINVLIAEVDKLLKENVKLKQNTKVLFDQNAKLKESVVKLSENEERATAKTQKSFSDSAIIVSADNFKVRDNKKEEQKKTAANGNEWLTEATLNAAKKMKIGLRD
jgi:hypothetical protein